MSNLLVISIHETYKVFLIECSNIDARLVV